MSVCTGLFDGSAPLWVWVVIATASGCGLGGVFRVATCATRVAMVGGALIGLSIGGALVSGAIPAERVQAAADGAADLGRTVWAHVRSVAVPRSEGGP